MPYRFGPFVADRTTYGVSRDNRRLELTPKLLDLLFYFLERPGTLITKETLLDAVWPGANVTDNALAQAISELRDALGDEPSAPAYIRTVARRGYRFVATVDVEGTSPTPSTSAQSASRAALAVLDFTNVSGDIELDWLAAGFAETVSSDLAALDVFHVVDRGQVVNACRRAAGSLPDLASALRVSRLVTGGYQRSGPRLRVTARIVDVARGESIADAKVDGPLTEVFALQDAISVAFARELGLSSVMPPGRPGVRETSSLDAYRAFIEGTLKIESLDTTQVRSSIADFERAIAIDRRYAIAYTGLANAEWVAYEMTRLAPEPDRRALAAGLEHAQQALRLDDGLGEAHGTLSFLLASATRFDDARVAAHRAVTIEPENWRHHYRLGHASWGAVRLRAFERALALYPQFAYAPFEMAMVHVARGELDAARDIVRQGVSGQDRQWGASDRFPAIGFHWLLGLLRAAGGDDAAALEALAHELAQANPHRMYGPEYAAAALVARGQIELAGGGPDRAAASFKEAFTHLRDLPHAHLGLAAVCLRRDDRRGARMAREHARRGTDVFRATGRAHDAALLEACDAAVHGQPEMAVRHLDQLLDGPPSYLGWTIPIEPFLRSLHAFHGFGTILARLAERTR